MLKAENLEKSFGETRAVEDLSLELEKGKIVGLLGPNGAGKTTSMQMLSGLLEPDSGKISVEGSLKEDVSVVFQETEYSSKMKVREFLRMMAVLNENEEDLENVIEDVGLGEYEDTFVGDLSGGNKKKMNMASGLLKDPAYLLLDEPMAGLDPRARRGVRGLIQEFSADHGVLVSTHSMDEAEKLCDRVVIIEDGEEVVSGDPDELISSIDSDFVIKAEGEVPEGFESDATVSEGFFELKTDEPDQVIRKLVESGEIDELENLSIEKPGLEEVFFEVTGRRYEEDN
jgi:ABC-2 type transport system ATP-binding protein